MSCQHDHPDDATCSECEFEAPTRNHFFTGKMMGAGEFQTEQDYHAEKMRHHNLRLHGWGVVCGLKVHQHPSMECHNRYVVIEPGSAIDCCGREIIVPHAEVLDVARHPAVERLREDPRAHTLQITLCYRECPTEEVPVLYDDCGCDEARCAPNRVLESYAFDIRVDPPLSEAACPEAAAAAFVSSDPSVGPRVIPAGANGVLPMIDPTDANRLQLLDTARSRRRTISLSAPVDAVVMSPDGEQVFAVSANATDNGPTFTVAVLDSEGGQINEVSATIDGVSASEVSLDPESIEIASAMVDGSNVRLVALDKWGGILHFIELSESQSDGHSINVGGPAHSLTLNADGSAAFVISENRVLRIELPPESATDTDYQEVTHHLGDSAEPVALTAFAADGVQRLAIAFSDAKVLIMNANADPTDAGANASLDLQLDHPPSLLYATADGSHLIACAALNGRINLQKIGNPAAPTPTVFATRTVESATPPILVLATAAGEVTRVDPPKWGDGGCNDLACETDDCSGCETPECLVLATLEGYRPNHTMLDADDSENDDSVRIDNRRDRRVLASTSKLQAWLRCLQHSEGVPGPQGPPGKDAEQVEQNAITKFNPTIEMVDCGKGPNIEGSIDNNEIKLHLEIPTCCDHKLNRISSINWNHAGKTLRDTIKSNGIAIGFEGPLILPDDHELLLKHCFIVEAEVEIEGDTKSLSSTAWTQLNGTYRVEFENGQPFSISFHRDSWPIRDLHVRIRLIGDLLKDLNGNAVDANHLPPWFSSGEEGYRTGNCIPGGTFYSWFHHLGWSAIAPDAFAAIPAPPARRIVMSTSTKTYAPCGSAAPQRRTDPCADDRMPSCPACGGLECLCRPRFFPGQLLTDEDLNRLEQYVIGKNRLRNRYLHGWGVACGLEVRCDPCDPAQVVVHNGYALSPCGDDIVVGGDQAVDICALIRECAPRREPVCDPPWNNPPEDCSARSRRWVLAICYDERPVRGITAQLGMGDTRCGCACGGSSCGCGTAAGSAVSGGGATPSPSRRRKATNPQCEPTQICEGYRFIAYPAPAEAPDQKVPTGDQLWPWLYAHRARYGPLIERVLCCAAQAMELRSRFDQNNGEDVDARAYVEYASALKAFLDEFPLGCSSIGDQDFGNLKLNLTPISRNVNPNQPPPKISDLDAILSKILTQCFCSALLPACPPPSPDNCVPLAVVTLAGDRCRVAGVCNWEARKLLLTWRTMEHWFSWLPWSRPQDWIAGLCCGGSQKMTVDLSALLFARIFQQDLAPRSKDRDPQIWDFNYERVRARAKELSALGASSTESDLSAAIARLIFEGKPTLSNLAMMNNVVERLEECEKRLKIEHD